MSFSHQGMQMLISLRQLLNDPIIALQRWLVRGDADVDIIKATVERSRHCTTTLVGEDTDLLLHYSRTDNEIIYFCSDAN